MKSLPGKNRFPFFSLFFFSLVLFAFVLVSCSKKENREELDQKNQGYPVSIIQATVENIPENVEINGSFVPSDKLDVKSEVEAKVVSVSVNEGDFINPNQPLATLDPEKLRLSLEVLQSEMRETEARIDAGLPVSTPPPPTRSLREPAPRNPQVRSSDEVGEERVTPETVPTDPTLRAEDATLDRLKSEIALAEKRLEGVQLNATLGGILTKKGVTAGSFVKPGDSLFQIVKIDPIFLQLYFPLEGIRSLQKGYRMEVYSEELPGQTLVGEVALIGPEIDSQKKGYEVKVSVPNTLLKLRGGMSGKVILPNFQFRKGIVLPASAILHQDQKKYVYKIVGENIAERQEVELGEKLGDRIEIKKGVREGDRVISRGHFTFDAEKEFVKVE